MSQQIVEAELNASGIIIPVVPNTIEYNDGSGEQSVRVASSGNGSVSQVYSNNVEMNKGMVKAQVYGTPDSINNVEILKSLRNNITLTLSQKLDNGQLFTKTFNNMALINHYTVQLQADGVIDLEFEGGQAI